MSAILTWKTVDAQSPLDYVLTVGSQDPQTMYLALLTWLTQKSIALCSAEEYADPNKLMANQMYCVAGDEAESHLVFQYLPTPDWGGEPPPPNFVVPVAYIQWLLVPAPPVAPVVKL